MWKGKYLFDFRFFLNIRTLFSEHILYVSYKRNI
jgi:hypothetical protein